MSGPNWDDLEEESTTPTWDSLSPVTPELVAGTPDERRRSESENIRREIGTTEPVELPVRMSQMPMGVSGILSPTLNSPSGRQRFLSGAASAMGPEDLKAFRDLEYGVDGHIEIGDNAMVRVPDKNGGYKWIVENPRGFDNGDIAQAAANLPQIISGVTSAVAMSPTQGAPIARLAKVSGVSAFASGVVGALQDAAMRTYLGRDIDPVEIAQRRGLETGIEFAAGILLPAGVDKFINNRSSKAAVKNFISQFANEGEQARQSLIKAGARPRTVAEAGDAVRELVPLNSTAAQAGDDIAKALNDFDSTARQNTRRFVRNSANEASERGMSAINATAPAIELAPSEVGKIVTTAVQKHAKDSREVVSGLYDKAYKLIREGGGSRPERAFIISLDNTKSAVEKAKKSLMVTPEGETSDLYAGMLTTLKRLDEVTDQAQRLEAVRATRSMVGQRLRGDGGEFSSMEEGAAKQLYAALSKDIEQSVAKYSGPGAAQLKAADMEYANLIGKFEGNSLLSRLETGGFDNPEDLIATLAKGGTGDWAALKMALPDNTFRAMRRATVDRILKSETTNIAGQEVVNIGKMGEALRGMQPEVKNVIFGNPRMWQSIEKAGKEFEFIQRNSGLLTKPSLPSSAAVQDLADEARTLGYDKINSNLRFAIKESEKRTESIGSSMSSLIKNGSVGMATGNPEMVLDSIIFSGKYGKPAVANMMSKLPPETREEIANSAFHYIFDNAKDASKSTLSKGVSTYSPERMLQKVFGSKEQTAVIREVLGEDRFNLILDWTMYTNSLAMKRAANATGQSRRRIADLVSRLPFPTLLAASVARTALERASGRAFLKQATPEASELFAKARLIESQPKPTAAGIALFQQAIETPGYTEYRDMMSELPPDERDALDQYLNN